MVEIIRDAYTDHITEKNLEYRYRDDHESGFAFPWKDGKVQLNSLSEKNYKWCQEHPEEVECLGIIEQESSYRVPALARCECGNEFHLSGNYYGCTPCSKCGRWYAMGGYEVNPPDQWNEEWEELT